MPPPASKGDGKGKREWSDNNRGKGGPQKKQRNDSFTAKDVEVAGNALRIPLLESLYADRIPPTTSNLRSRWAEIVQKYEPTPDAFPKKVSSEALLKIFARQTGTLVIADFEAESQRHANGDSNLSMTLKKLAGAPGDAINDELLKREVSEDLKLPAGSELFLACLRVVPKDFKGFVDPMEADPYPDDMWQKFEQYLQSLIDDKKDEDFTFHGGRYGAAKALQKRDLAFLSDRSLGEVSHIVQIALERTDSPVRGRGLLSYQRDKTITPRALSQVHRDADLGNASGSEKCVGQDCETDEERWNELRTVLKTVLADHPEGRSLALLKVDVQRRFNKALQQSVFHAVKLSDVFQSPELSADFEVIRTPSKTGTSQITVRLKGAAIAGKSDGVKSTGPVVVPPPAKAGAADPPVADPP